MQQLVRQMLLTDWHFSKSIVHLNLYSKLKKAHDGPFSFPVRPREGPLFLANYFTEPYPDQLVNQLLVVVQLFHLG